MRRAPDRRPPPGWMQPILLGFGMLVLLPLEAAKKLTRWLRRK